MGQSSFIQLQAGEPTWMRISRVLITAMAALTLLLANSPWTWKLLALAGLLLVSLLIEVQAQRMAAVRRLRLYPNGTATLLMGDHTEVPAVIRDSAWLCPWVSVLCLSTTDRRSLIRVVIGLSANHPDNYRRMLRLLRLGVTADSGDNMAAP